MPAITQAHGSALVLLRRLDVVVREQDGKEHFMRTKTICLLTVGVAEHHTHTAAWKCSG